MINTSNYTKIRELGKAHGGRSTWLAEDGSGRQVVLKEFVFGNPQSNFKELETIEQEANTLATLNHPQIPKLLDRFETEQGYSIVMEYIEGETLAYRIGFPISRFQLMDIAKQSLEILSYIHDRGLLHRDIKPENIVVGNDGNVHLVDFGLSRNPNNVGSSTALMGTQGFMPLEQLRGVFKPASDLYALGMTLACLATGTETSSAISLIAEDSSVRFDLSSRYGRDFDKWLHKLTAVDVRDRPQTARTALAWLGLVDAVEVADEPIKLRFSATGFIASFAIVAGISFYHLLTTPTPTQLAQTAEDDPSSAQIEDHRLDESFIQIENIKAQAEEYDRVVEKHVCTNQGKVKCDDPINWRDLKLATTKEELSPEFSVYRFRHSKLQGAFGYLTVLVDRSTEKSKAISVKDVGGKPPIVTIKGKCLSVPQIRLGVTKNREICFD